MKILNFTAGLLLLSALVLNTLPDLVLDLVHEHEHSHDCAPNPGDLKTIEKDHVHCQLHHVFFESFIPAQPEKIGVLAQHSPFTPALPQAFEFEKFSPSKGRSPPVI
jgi:hypothetical protein